MSNLSLTLVDVKLVFVDYVYQSILRNSQSFLGTLSNSPVRTLSSLFWRHYDFILYKKEKKILTFCRSLWCWLIQILQENLLSLVEDMRRVNEKLADSSIPVYFEKVMKRFWNLYLPIGIIFLGFVPIWVNPSSLSWFFSGIDCSQLLRSSDKLELILNSSSDLVKLNCFYLLFIRKCVTSIICAPICAAAPDLAPCWV